MLNLDRNSQLRAIAETHSIMNSRTPIPETDNSKIVHVGDARMRRNSTAQSPLGTHNWRFLTGDDSEGLSSKRFKRWSSMDETPISQNLDELENARCNKPQDPILNTIAKKHKVTQAYKQKSTWISHKHARNMSRNSKLSGYVWFCFCKSIKIEIKWVRVAQV